MNTADPSVLVYAIGSTWSIGWTSASDVSLVSIYLYSSGDVPVLRIASSVANKPPFSYTLPSTLPAANTYFIRVYNVNNMANYDEVGFLHVFLYEARYQYSALSFLFYLYLSKHLLFFRFEINCQLFSFFPTE